MNEFVLMLGSNLEYSLVAKASLLLVAGLTIWVLARKTEASMRHLILGLTFGGLLLLPVLVLVSPPVGVPLTARLEEHPEPVEVVRSKVDPVLNEIPTAGGWRMPELQSFWMAGVVLLFGLLGIDLWKLNRLTRAGIPVSDLHLRFEDVLAEIGRKVEILLHERVSAPMTWGVFRPVILLPNDALNWEVEELKRTLIHEMEHVRRADWLTLMMARVVCSVYWFHPLVWVASRRLLLEAECACDDAVVRREECTEYAEQLVRLARRISTGSAEAALGMARRSDLGKRVTAILDSSRKRSRTSVPSLLVAATIAVLMVGSLAPLRAVALEDDSSFSELDRELLEASRKGNLSAVRALLDAGANPNLAVQGDGSPLIAAALRGQIEMVRLLVAKGADVDMAVRGDGSPLIAAASRGKLEVVQFLLDRGAKIDLEVPGDENALIGASADGHLAVVEILVKRGANVNVRIWAEGSGQRPGEWRSPMSMAKRRKHDAVVAYLKSAGAQD